MANSKKINEELRWELARRRQEAEALAASQARLQYLLNTSPAIIYSREPEGDYATTFISENVQKQLGYEPWEPIDDPRFWLKHIHPDDRPVISAKLFRVFENEYYVFKYRFRHRDGSYRLIHDELRLVRDAEDHPLEIVGCMLEITG